MRGELFNLEDRTWVAENAVKEVTNQVTGSEIKIADLTKVVKYVRNKRFEKGLSPQITIMPIKEDKRKERNYSISQINDREFDLIYGKFLGFNKDGTPRFKRFPLRESSDLDITRDEDAEIWIMMCFFLKLEGSVYEDAPYFKVYDKSREALESTVKADGFMKAAGRIKSMDIKEKIYFLRYAYPAKQLTSSYNEDIINGILFEVAMKDPDNFNRKFASKARSISEVFHSAIQTGILQNVPEKGYVYQGVNVGITEMDAISYLSKDNTILTSLLEEVAKHDNVLKSVATNTNNLKKTPGLNKKDLEQSEKLIKEKSNNNPKVPKTEDNSEFV